MIEEKQNGFSLYRENAVQIKGLLLQATLLMQKNCLVIEVTKFICTVKDEDTQVSSTGGQVINGF